MQTSLSVQLAAGLFSALSKAGTPGVDDAGHQGVWVTIQGRAIFIREGETLAQAAVRTGPPLHGTPTDKVPAGKAPSDVPASTGLKNVNKHRALVERAVRADRWPPLYRGAVKKEIEQALKYEGPIAKMRLNWTRYAPSRGPVPEDYLSSAFRAFAAKEGEWEKRFDTFYKDVAGKSPGEVLQAAETFSQGLPEDRRTGFLDAVARIVVGRALAAKFAPTKLPEEVPQYVESMGSATPLTSPTPRQMVKAKATVETAQRVLAAWVSKEKWPSGIAVLVSRDSATKERATANLQKKSIKISHNETPSVVVHEIVHHLEAQNPEAFDLAVAFRSARATGEPGPLKGSSDPEDFVPGEFIVPYVGKIDEDEAETRSTEVLTVGADRLTPDDVSVESLRRSAEEFAEQDPEHFLVLMMAFGRLKLEGV